MMHHAERRVFGMIGALSSLLCLAAGSAAAEVPHLDHVIVVIMENHSYDQTRALPSTASLIVAGASFADSRAITHPSQPNYIALWSGSTQGVTSDACPPPGSPYSTENLGHACEAAGLTWKAYSEDLPAPGSMVCTANSSKYARKHAPWTQFANLAHDNERPYTDFTTDVAQSALPNLAFAIPNQCNDQHSCALATGDAWLAQNIPAMLQAVGPRGLVVLTYDEDDHSAGNQILTVFLGALVRPNYISAQPVTHYTILRTLCDGLGITPFAAAATETPITDVWAATPVALQAWTTMKLLYR